MNYNEYDNNGNKSNFNLSEALNDKKQKARIFLLGYLIFIVLIIVVVRLSTTSVPKNNNNDDNKEPSDNVPEEKEDVVINDEVAELFSFVDQNNYNFKVTINYQDQIFSIDGKRFDDKYDFTYSNGVETLYFLGTTNNIKVKEEDGYRTVIFPYVYVNFFDNNELKSIIRNATLVDGIYQISNESINEIVSLKGTMENKDLLNTFELLVKNNKIVGINIDCSNAISDLQNDELSTKIKIEYENFGLVEDFELKFD